MRCPICKIEVEPIEKNKYFPFCCDRCRLVDLGRWLDGKYQVPIELTDEDPANQDPNP